MKARDFWGRSYDMRKRPSVVPPRLGHGPPTELKFRQELRAGWQRMCDRLRARFARPEEIEDAFERRERADMRQYRGGGQ